MAIASSVTHTFRNGPDLFGGRLADGSSTVNVFTRRRFSIGGFSTLTVNSTVNWQVLLAFQKKLSRNVQSAYLNVFLPYKSGDAGSVVHLSSRLDELACCTPH